MTRYCCLNFDLGRTFLYYCNILSYMFGAESASMRRRVVSGRLSEPRLVYQILSISIFQAKNVYFLSIKLSMNVFIAL